MPFCPYCNKEFGRISSLQNHSAFCAIQHEGRYAACNSELELDIPPIRDIYIVVQKLVKENEKLKIRINELEKFSQREKKRMCLIDWLNTNKIPTITFSQWVNNIKVTKDDFTYTLTNNCLCGIMEIIKKNMIEQLPICGFDQKLKTLFIYHDKAWRLIEKEEFYRFTDNIIRKLGKQFDLWMKKNEQAIRKNSETLHLYTKKLYTTDTEEIAKRLYLRLYNHVKYNLKNIIDYEFTF